MKFLSWIATLLATCALAVGSTALSAAETTEFRIARQPGLVYLQIVLMEEKKLVEKHAAALGLQDVKITWTIITSGGVLTEALLSDSIDIATTGVSNMLLLWGRTNGGAKGKRRQQSGQDNRDPGATITNGGRIADQDIH